MSSPVARWAGRWRVATRIARRDAVRHKGRTTLVAVMVGLPVLLASFTATTLTSDEPSDATYLTATLGPDLQAVVRHTTEGPDLVQNARGDAWGGSWTSDADERHRADVEGTYRDALPGRPELSLVVDGTVVVVGPELRDRVSARQADLSIPAVAAMHTVDIGLVPAGPHEAALSADVARELGVGIGDQVDLESAANHPDTVDRGTVTLSGLLAPGRPGPQLLLPADGPLVVPGPQDPISTADGALSWFVLGDDPVTWADVRSVNAAGGVVASRSVVLDPPPEADAMYGATETSTYALVGAVAAVGLLQAVLMIGPAFAVGARSSARSLALVAANGGDRATLTRVTVASGLVIGAVSSAVAAAAGALAVAALYATGVLALPNLVVPVLPLVAMVGVGTLIAVAAAWLPARRAAHADVVAVLGGRRGESTAKRWPSVVGAVLGVAGVAGALTGAAAGSALALAAGVVVAEIGLVLGIGGIVSALGRLARRLPLAPRLALRDAARNRSRTSPAVAAVVVAVAVAVGGSIFLYSDIRDRERSYQAGAGHGTVSVSAMGNADRRLDATTVQEVTRALEHRLDLDGPVHEVHTLAAADDAGLPLTLVPTTGLTHETSSWNTGSVIYGTIVDDGSLVEMLGVPEPEAAQAALAAGRAVVPSAYLQGAESIRLAVYSLPGDEPHDGPKSLDRTIELPATGVGHPLHPRPNDSLVIPPQLLDELDGTTTVIGVVAKTAALPSPAVEQTLYAELSQILPGSGADGDLYLHVERGWQAQGDDGRWGLLFLVAAAGVIALAATWTATALAAAESRSDLATLAAVGASPTTRRRVAGAQAGTIAVLGTVLGTVTGLVLGTAFVRYSATTSPIPDPRFAVEIPWEYVGGVALGLPLLAIVAAMLVTRSRLPLTRRLTS